MFAVNSIESVNFGPVPSKVNELSEAPASETEVLSSLRTFLNRSVNRLMRTF